jgi:hypothetical protein
LLKIAIPRLFRRLNFSPKHWQFFAKTSAISQHGFATFTYLGHLGKCDTNGNDPIYVALPKVAKARDEDFSGTELFCLQALPMEIQLEAAIRWACNLPR